MIPASPRFMLCCCCCCLNRGNIGRTCFSKICVFVRVFFCLLFFSFLFFFFFSLSLFFLGGGGEGGLFCLFFRLACFEAFWVSLNKELLCFTLK